MSRPSRIITLGKMLIPLFVSVRSVLADPPLNWCATELALQEVRPCGEGSCDSPLERNSWIPVSPSPTIKVRIQFIVFADDDGFNPVADELQINLQVGVLNTAFAPYGIEFDKQVTTFVPCKRYKQLCGGVSSTCDSGTGTPSTCVDNGWLCRGSGPVTEEQRLKAYYAANYAAHPESELNVFVVHTAATIPYFRGVGYFPWCDDAAGNPGGVIIDGAQVGGATGCGGQSCGVLVHEIGHNLGLWHTHHGAVEVPCEDGCREGYDSQGDCPTDVEWFDYRGDFCCDTPATPVNYYCSDPVDLDPCSSNFYGDTDERNYMGYTGNGCWNHFTRQQAGRLRCWTCNALSAISGWINSDDCNNNGKKDVCDIGGGTSGDCNADGIPDECQQALLYGACCIDPGPPQVCVSTTQCVCDDLYGNFAGLGTKCGTTDCMIIAMRPQPGNPDP